MFQAWFRHWPHSVGYVLAIVSFGRAMKLFSQERHELDSGRFDVAW